jgi:hypothetical protein
MARTCQRNDSISSRSVTIIGIIWVHYKKIYVQFKERKRNKAFSLNVVIKKGCLALFY